MSMALRGAFLVLIGPLAPAWLSGMDLIASVEAVPLAARLREPFRFGNVVRTSSANVLVRITTESGLVGYGEACPVPQLTAETQESVVALGALRGAPEVVGQDAGEGGAPLAENAERP